MEPLPRGGSIPEEPQFTIPVFGESCHFHICPFCSRERLPGSETLESHNLFCPHSTMVSTVWAGLQAPGLFSEPETRALTLQAFRSFWGLWLDDFHNLWTFEMTHIEATSIHIWLRYDKNWETIILSCTIKCGCSNLHCNYELLGEMTPQQKDLKRNTRYLFIYKLRSFCFISTVVGG